MSRGHIIRTKTKGTIHEIRLDGDSKKTIHEIQDIRGGGVGRLGVMAVLGFEEMDKVTSRINRPSKLGVLHINLVSLINTSVG